MSDFYKVTFWAPGVPADDFQIQFGIDETPTTPVITTGNTTGYNSFIPVKSAVVEVNDVGEGDVINFRVRGVHPTLAPSPWSRIVGYRKLTLPVVQTLSATLIRTNDAELNADISNVVGYTAQYRFRWREVGEQIWKQTPIKSITSDSLVTEQIVNLDQWTNYEYEIIAWNSVGITTRVWGELLGFRTRAERPDLELAGTDKVSQTETRLKANISNVINQGYIATYGFRYKESNDIGWTEVIGGTTTTDGEVSVVLELPINQYYDWYAIAWNNFSKNTTFRATGLSQFNTIPSTPTVVTQDITQDNLDELKVGIDIGGVTGFNYTAEYGFEYRTLGSSVWNDTGILGTTNQDTSENEIIQINEFDVTWEVRAYAQNSISPSNTREYGSIKTIEVVTIDPAIGLYKPIESTTSTELNFLVSLIEGPSFFAPYGAQYRVVGETNWTDVGLVGQTNVNGTFSHTIEGLDPNTDYEYRVYIYNEFSDNEIRYSNQFEVLVIGGGGAGGYVHDSSGGSLGSGGGGGAGQYLEQTIEHYEYQTYITVGQGGQPRTQQNDVNFGGQGQPSMFGNVLTAYGGGTGQSEGGVERRYPLGYFGDGVSVGSGGGGSAASKSSGIYFGRADAGFNGGSSEFGTTGGDGTGGGGGGASQAGYAASDPERGRGGNGKTWVDGVTRAAGGGAGGARGNLNFSASGRPGGTGGGGNGGDGKYGNVNDVPEDGQTRTGSGGGGTGNTAGQPSGAGGSGLVVVRYYGDPITDAGALQQSGNYTYHYFYVNQGFNILESSPFNN